jgi:hypothetical protein
MKQFFGRTSLSRDFALISAIIIFLVFMISLWVAYKTYETHAERIAEQLAADSDRVDEVLASQIGNAVIILESLGKYIAQQDTIDDARIAEILKTYSLQQTYFSSIVWINQDQQVVVDNNVGMLARPVDVADRDYVKKSLAEPWGIQIGRPIEGRITRMLIMPVAIGVTNLSGDFMGTLSVGLNIRHLRGHISRVLNNPKVSVSVFSKSFVPLFEVAEPDMIEQSLAVPIAQLSAHNLAENPQGLLYESGEEGSINIRYYYKVSKHYPFLLVMGYGTALNDSIVRGLLMPRLFMLLALGAFLICLLWFVKLRVIKPVEEISRKVGKLLRSEEVEFVAEGPIEIASLSLNLNQVSQYVQEKQRISEELLDKIEQYKNSSEVNFTRFRIGQAAVQTVEIILRELPTLNGSKAGNRSKASPYIEDQDKPVYFKAQLQLLNTLLEFMDALAEPVTPMQDHSLIRNTENALQLLKPLLQQYRILMDKEVPERHVVMAIAPSHFTMMLLALLLRQIIVCGYGLTLELRLTLHEGDKESTLQLSASCNRPEMPQEKTLQGQAVEPAARVLISLLGYLTDLYGGRIERAEIDDSPKDKIILSLPCKLSHS